MKALITKLRSIPKIVILAVVLIVVGLGIMIPKGLGMLDFFKEAQYARQHDFASGNISTDLMRPWMTIRYIAVAYSVPQKYLLESIDMPNTIENSMSSVKRMNAKLRLGNNANGQPELISKLQASIKAYQANPVVTGLTEDRVMDWMTVKYVSNSTGIPVEKIFAEIGLPVTGHEYIVLGYLSDMTSYKGGIKALTRDIQKVVDSNKVMP